MKLFHSPTTPFGRKVMVALLETGLEKRVTVSPAMGTPTDPGTMPLAQNPLGKIPALVTDEGEAIYDSRVICRYIDDLSGGALYPAAPRLWRTLTLEATADGILDAAILVVYESRIRPEEKRFADWTEARISGSLMLSTSIGVSAAGARMFTLMPAALPSRARARPRLRFAAFAAP